MFFYCDIPNLNKLYFAHTYFHISFCTSPYYSTYKINLGNKLKLQKRAIKITLRFKYYELAKGHI